MKTILQAFVIAFIFGLGLAVSSMTDPAKVLGFLDLFGLWDPSLGFVMGGALIVMAVGYALGRKRGTTPDGQPLILPSKSDIDAPLIGGAAIFGLGWGLVGFCPGPAIAALGSFQWEVMLFVVSMVAGMALHGVVFNRAAPSTPASSTKTGGGKAAAQGDG